jgi:hypothetical protein
MLGFFFSFSKKFYCIYIYSHVYTLFEPHPPTLFCFSVFFTSSCVFAWDLSQTMILLPMASYVAESTGVLCHSWLIDWDGFCLGWPGAAPSLTCWVARIQAWATVCVLLTSRNISKLVSVSSDVLRLHVFWENKMMLVHLTHFQPWVWSQP